jgi:hypothetical protein
MPAPNAELAAKARQWALDVRRFQRQEQAQGHISPTDAAFLSRLQTFLSDEVAMAFEPAGETASKQ